MKLEYIALEAIFLAPKTYYVLTSDGVSISKGLGHNPSTPFPTPDTLLNEANTNNASLNNSALTSINNRDPYYIYYSLLFKGNLFKRKEAKWVRDLAISNITIKDVNTTYAPLSPLTASYKRDLIFEALPISRDGLMTTGLIHYLTPELVNQVISKGYLEILVSTKPRRI